MTDPSRPAHVAAPAPADRPLDADIPNPAFSHPRRVRTAEEPGHLSSPPGPPRGYGQLARSAAPLLNQQCWCWGCDIRRPDGNVLLAHGFRRQRVPSGTLGSSAYTLDRDGSPIVLWGFGIFCGHPPLGGVFLPRQGFQPRVLDTAAAPTQVWELGQLMGASRPCAPPDWTRACALLVRAFDWIAHYESWVEYTCGTAYRVACLAAWRKQAVPAAAMAERWRALAEGCGGLGSAPCGAEV